MAEHHALDAQAADPLPPGRLALFGLLAGGEADEDTCIIDPVEGIGFRLDEARSLTRIPEVGFRFESRISEVRHRRSLSAGAQPRFHHRGGTRVTVEVP